jgi:hypothetical protein
LQFLPRGAGRAAAKTPSRRTAAPGLRRNAGGMLLAYTMTMLRLKPRQRAVAVEKLPDVANIVLGVLVFGQFVDERPVSIWLVAAGLAIWLIVAGATLLLAGGNHD